MPPAAYQVVGRALRVGSRGRFLGCNFETNTALLSRDNGLMMRADEDTASDGTVDISVEYQDRTEVIRCRQGQSILEAVEASGLWDEVPSSCRAGVCTTCAAWLLSGEVDDPYAAIDPSIRQQGFILTCSSTPKPDSGPVCVRLGAYDFVYELQYGRFEKTS
jgi:ferredoxin